MAASLAAARASSSNSNRRLVAASASCTFSLARIREMASEGAPTLGWNSKQLSLTTDVICESERISKAEEVLPLGLASFVSRFFSAAKRCANSMIGVPAAAPWFLPLLRTGVGTTSFFFFLVEMVTASERRPCASGRSARDG
jgi:hypothetical protein